MREFVAESALPFCGVCVFILGLTVALFDVPRAPEPAQLPAAPVLPDPPVAAASAIPRAPAPPRVDQMNDILARAMRQLNAVSKQPPRPPVVAGTMPDMGQPTSPIAAATPSPADTGLLQAVSSLGEAIKAIHEARTEEDIVQAEGRMRGAREQMEATCNGSAPGNPLCASAAQIRSLGY